MKNSKNLIAVAVGAALGGMSSVAGSAGFALIEQNASGMGNAYAGQAAAAYDASTIYFNPAGMTLLPRRQVVVAGHAIRPKSEFVNTGSGLAPFQTSLGGNGGDAGDWAIVPNAYLSWQLTPQWWVGVGVNVPFGLKTEYDVGWVGRFHALESELKTINVNPSIAWKVSDAVSLGAGVSWQRAEATLTNSVNYTGAAVSAVCASPAPPPLFPSVAACAGTVTGALPPVPGVPVVAPGSEGPVKLEGNDSSWGWNVGALFNIWQGTRIGISYRSEIEYDIDASVIFGNRPAALAGAAALRNGPVTTSITLPASASWSIFHPVNSKWDFLGDITWTEWSSLKSLDIYRTNGTLLTRTPFNWDDTFRFSAGANYHHSGALTFRFGVAYDQSPANDADRTPRVPDQDRTWLSIGGQYRMSKQAVLDFGYSYIFVKDPSINLCGPATAATVECAGKNRLVGSYDSNVNILSAQFRYSF